VCDHCGEIIRGETILIFTNVIDAAEDQDMKLSPMLDEALTFCDWFCVRDYAQNKMHPHDRATGPRASTGSDVVVQTSPPSWGDATDGMAMLAEEMQ
jgi:hypothetical protein